MRILGKYLWKLLVILLIPPLIYSLLVIFGGLIPINKTSELNGPIKIYIVQNGSHTDIVVPTANEIINWENIILAEHFPGTPQKAKYYSFGWGDREFYRNTPHWEDLHFKIAFKALFLDTPSAIHVTRLNGIDSEKIIEINMEAKQYKRLAEYLLKHLEFDQDRGLTPLKFNYSDDDVFYASKSSFHAFRTCNSWVNNALKYSGLRACLWTPLAWPLFWQYS